MLPVEHIHLEHVLQTVCVLESVVLRSFGPDGGQVLFTRDTGQAMLSRSGMRILTALRLEHPLARMVVECVLKHSTVTGDGSKTFILLLASLLRMIHTMACKDPNVSRTHNSREVAEAATARHLADELLAFALEELDDLIAMGVVPYGCCLSWDDFTAKTQLPAHTNNHCVQKLLASFFHSRLGRTHCDFISDLTCDLLTHWKFKNDQPSLSLLFINDNFPALHTPVSGFPISCSRLIEGQVIHRDFATPCPQTDHQPVKAVVFTGYLQPKLLSAGEVLELGCGEQGKERSLVQFNAWAERSLECVIANLKRLGVSVLLSAVKQSAAVLALAAQTDMCIVECVSEDELSLFAQLSRTRPVSDCWMIEPDHIAMLTFCRPILLGGHRALYDITAYVTWSPLEEQSAGDFNGTQLPLYPLSPNYCGSTAFSKKLGIPADSFELSKDVFCTWYVHVDFHESEERVMVKPCSLVICGPGEGQTDQYACAFRDAVCMLLSTWEPMSMTPASKRTSQSNKSTSLHMDHQIQQCVLETGCVIPAGGTFEFLLHSALLQHGRSCSVSDNTNRSIPAISQLLANALLSVPRQIYSHSPQCFLQTQTRLLSLIQSYSHPSSLADKQEHNTILTQGRNESERPLEEGKRSMHCCKEADMSSKVFMLDLGLESVSCKYQLLLAVLQCVSSLLKVDTMLHTHTALHTQSCGLPNIS